MSFCLASTLRVCLSLILCPACLVDAGANHGKLDFHSLQRTPFVLLPKLLLAVLLKWIGSRIYWRSEEREREWERGRERGRERKGERQKERNHNVRVCHDTWLQLSTRLCFRAPAIPFIYSFIHLVCPAWRHAHDPETQPMDSTITQIPFHRFPL